MRSQFTGRPQRADFSDIVGRWLSDNKLDEVLESQRQVDPSDWSRWHSIFNQLADLFLAMPQELQPM
jgi:hypothetical protein